MTKAQTETIEAALEVTASTKGPGRSGRLGEGRRRDRAAVCPPAAPEEETDGQGGEQMDQPQPHAGPHTAEDPNAQNADEEHGVRVVAEGQQPPGLRLGQQSPAVQVRCRPGSHGIARRRTQQQGGGPVARETVKSHQAPDGGRATPQSPETPAGWTPPERGTGRGSLTGRTGSGPLPPRRGSPGHRPGTRAEPDRAAGTEPSVFSYTSPPETMRHIRKVCILFRIALP